MIGQTDWLPLEAWAEFKKMRRAKKAPMTEYAEKLMLKRLQEMVTQQGQSAQAVLDQSIIHNWSNIYCVKIDDPGPTTKLRVVPYQTPNEKAKEWADRLTGAKRHELRPDIIDITPSNIVD